MAKAGSVKTIERHVEKIVLAVCVLFLVLASWHWLLSSPNKVIIVNPNNLSKTVQVEPTEADEMLKKAAGKLQQQYDESDVAKTIPPVPMWIAALAELRTAQPMPDDGINLASPHEPIGPVSKPKIIEKITRERLMAMMPAPAKPEVSASVVLPKRTPLGDTVLAEGLSNYDLKALADEWRPKLADAAFQTVIPYKVIVEVQKAPADGDWAKAKTVTVEMPALRGPEGEAVAMPEIPDFPANPAKEVRDVRDRIMLMTRQILEPRYLPVWDAPAKQWLQPVVPGMEIMSSPEPAPAAPAGGLAPAAAPMPGATGVVGAPMAPAAPTGPTPVVFFDDSTMQVGSTYRYRIKLVAINPLLTYPDAVDDDHKADASEKFVTSPASPWSDPVSVRREVYFFLTGANSLSRPPTMTVTIYARQWGQLTREKFAVQVGDAIGGVRSVDLIDPIDKSTKSVEVDFSTGCVVMGLDFNKTLRGRFTRTSLAMLYASPDGKIHTRIKVWDDANDKQKQLQRILENAGQ